MRKCLTVITYLNHFGVQPGLVHTLNTMRTEFGRADTWWVNNGNTNQHTQARWDQWIRDLLDNNTQRVRDFIDRWANEMLKYWGVRTGAKANQVVKILETFERQANSARINYHGLD